VVVFLVTENWLASYECFGEFQASFYMGKRMIPLFLLPEGRSLGEEAAGFVEKARRVAAQPDYALHEA